MKVYNISVFRACRFLAFNVFNYTSEFSHFSLINWLAFCCIAKAHSLLQCRKSHTQVSSLNLRPYTYMSCEFQCTKADKMLNTTMPKTRELLRSFIPLCAPRECLTLFQCETYVVQDSSVQAFPSWQRNTIFNIQWVLRSLWPLS